MVTRIEESLECSRAANPKTRRSGKELNADDSEEQVQDKKPVTVLASSKEKNNFSILPQMELLQIVYSAEAELKNMNENQYSLTVSSKLSQKELEQMVQEIKE